MARNNNGRGLHAPTWLLDLPPDLNSLKLAELKTLCQRFQLMERVARAGRLNVKAPYIEVLEAFLAASAAPVNDSSAIGSRFCINTETPSEAEAKCSSINTDAATKRDADIEVTNCTVPNERTVSNVDVVSNCVDLTATLATVVFSSEQNILNTDAISDRIGSDAESLRQKADVQALATNAQTASKQYAESLLGISAPSAIWKNQSSRMASNAEPESDCTVVEIEECAPAATSQTETDAKAVWQRADDSICDRIALNADIASSCGDCNADETLSSGGEFVENPYGALDSDAYESLGDEPTQAEPLGGDAKVSVNSSLGEPGNSSILMDIGCSSNAPPTVSEQLESGNERDADAALTKLLNSETVGIDSDRTGNFAPNAPQGEVSLSEQPIAPSDEIASKSSVSDTEAKEQTVVSSSNDITTEGAFVKNVKSFERSELAEVEDVSRTLFAALNDCPNCEGTGEEKSVFGHPECDWGHTVYSPCSECNGTGKLTDAQLMNYLGIADDCHQPSNSYCSCQDNPDIPPLAEWLLRARDYYANEYGKDIEQIQILPLGENSPGNQWGADDAISYPLTTKGYRVWVKDDEPLEAIALQETQLQKRVDLLCSWAKTQTQLMAQKYGEEPERIFLSIACLDQRVLGDNWNFKETIAYDENTNFAVYMRRANYSPSVKTLIGDAELSKIVSGAIAALKADTSQPLEPTIENILRTPQLTPHREELERILRQLSPHGRQLAALGFLEKTPEIFKASR